MLEPHFRRAEHATHMALSQVPYLAHVEWNAKLAKLPNTGVNLDFLLPLKLHSTFPQQGGFRLSRATAPGVSATNRAWNRFFNARFAIHALRFVCLVAQETSCVPDGGLKVVSGPIVACLSSELHIAARICPRRSLLTSIGCRTGWQP